MSVKLRLWILSLVFAVALIVTATPTTEALTSQSQIQRTRIVGTTASAPSESATPPGQPSEPEPEVVRVETNLVNTLFTAFDKDRHFITTLRAEDVRIFENDVAQPVSLFERETDRPLSLAVLVYTSESQRGVLEDEKIAARTF